MKYIKAFEKAEAIPNMRLPISREDLEKVDTNSPYFTTNTTDHTLYKTAKVANNWYYNIKYYYRKPGYTNYCFLKNYGPTPSQFWVEEDRLMIPTTEELEKYMILHNQHKYNI